MISDSDSVLRDYFVENVWDLLFRKELRKFVCDYFSIFFFDV